MSKTEQYFRGAEDLRDIDLSNLVKSDKNLLGSGFFSNVYTVRDESGNVAPDYVMKALVKGMFVDRFIMNIRRKFGDIQSESSMSIDPNFRAEVDALVDLKGQQIGPNIVYANYKKYYYVIEKMDETLVDMIEKNTLTPSQTMKLLALGDRYLLSKYFHDDMHPPILCGLKN
jgi:serine/threonine protein kinase